MAKPCIDCGGGKRPAPHPGPRCHTHHKKVVGERKARAHGRRIEATYGLTGEEYQSLYEFQGGKCFICQRATGKTRKLSVDHDHKTGNVRGLLCRTCNNMLGHARDATSFFLRAVGYLAYPPYDHWEKTHGIRLEVLPADPADPQGPDSGTPDGTV